MAQKSRRGLECTPTARESHHVTRGPTLPFRVMRDSPLTELK
jgi:hypothetical protein